ncbi:MAG TPA: GNAT family N-acetyltransferase [Acidimicrobiales bacterium]|jgi:RimJ/RimL family protein N-acetyltransferase
MTTERLVLRPFCDEDRSPFAELQQHPLVVEFMGHRPDQAECDAALAHMGEGCAPPCGYWAVDLVGGSSCIGLVSLNPVDPSLPPAPGLEISWRLHPDHWDQGYATEAAAAVLDHGFSDADTEEIIAFRAAVNLRSQGVMLRLGLVQDETGDFDHPRLPPDSSLRPHVVYRIRADEWQMASQGPPTLIS